MCWEIKKLIDKKKDHISKSAGESHKNDTLWVEIVFIIWGEVPSEGWESCWFFVELR